MNPKYFLIQRSQRWNTWDNKGDSVWRDVVSGSVNGYVSIEELEKDNSFALDSFNTCDGIEYYIYEAKPVKKLLPKA